MKDTCGPTEAHKDASFDWTFSRLSRYPNYFLYHVISVPSFSFHTFLNPSAHSPTNSSSTFSMSYPIRWIVENIFDAPCWFHSVHMPQPSYPRYSYVGFQIRFFTYFIQCIVISTLPHVSAFYSSKKPPGSSLLATATGMQVSNSESLFRIRIPPQI